MADLNSLEREIEELRARVARLEQQLAVAKAPSSPPVEAAPTGLPKEPLSRPAPVTASSPPPVPKPARRALDLERTIGVRWFNLIGALALIIGIGYFLKYAIDNEWVGPTGRVVLGILAGIGLMMWGEVIRKRPQYRLLSLGMAGTGISALYLSIFAAFSFYQLVDQIPAFIFMVLVTATAVFLSVRYNSLTIALVGLLGGFLTPALLSTGENRPIELFTYLLILNAGTLALAFKKDWKVINILCVVFSYLWFGTWFVGSYSTAQRGVAFTFVSLFFILFAALAFVHNITYKKKTALLDAFIILGNAVVYFLFALIIIKDWHALHGLFALGLSALYFVFGVLAYRRNQEDRLLLYLLLSVAVTLLVIAVPLQFDGRWVSISWATMALCFWWIGITYKVTKAQIAAFVLFLFSVWDLLVFGSGFSYFDPEANQYSFTPVFNARFLTYLYVIATLAGGIILAKRAGAELARTAIAIFSVTVALMGLIALSIESDSYFSALELDATRSTTQDPEGFPQHNPATQEYVNANRLTISAVWALYSMALIVVGFYRKNKPLRLVAMAIFGLTIFKVFLFDLSFLEGLYRIVSFIGLGIVLMLVSFLYQKYRNLFDEAAAKT
jgi:uncharacterized membrane protein